MPHPTLADLREALAYVAEMITERPDGETYLPIFQALETEIEARATDHAPPASVPFFRNSDEESLFLRLRGHKTPYDAKG